MSNLQIWFEARAVKLSPSDGRNAKFWKGVYKSLPSALPLSLLIFERAEGVGGGAYLLFLFLTTRFPCDNSPLEISYSLWSFTVWFMLINPGAKQRVRCFEAQEKHQEKVKKKFECAIHRVSMWDSERSWNRRGVGVGTIGKKFVFGFVSLSPIVLFSVRKLARETWCPSGGHANGNQLRNNTQDSFHCLQLYKWKKKRKWIFVCFFLFILAPGINDLFFTLNTQRISWWKVPLVSGRARSPLHVKLLS